MKFETSKLTGCATGLILAALVSSGASAQSAEENKKDKTGTNPINFTHDFRIYHEASKLETDGDGAGHDRAAIDDRQQNAAFMHHRKTAGMPALDEALDDRRTIVGILWKRRAALLHPNAPAGAADDRL